MMLNLFHAVLLVAAVLCCLVAGVLFAFAVVVMPGIGRLDDISFIRTFQVIDRVIQNNQALFVLVWVGSVVAVIAAAVAGLWMLSGLDRVLIVAAALVYVAGVQLPTGMINVPLNNQIQRLDVLTMTDAARRNARNTFELRWNRWNRIRTLVAVVVAVLLLLVLLRA